MKRILSVFLIAVLPLVVFAGCGKDTTEPTTTTTAAPTSIVVKIPASSLAEDFSEEDFYQKLDGIEGIFHTKNDETNEYTLQMTEAAYKKLKEIEAKVVLTAFEEKKNNTENYITDIEYNEDFRNIKVIADREKLPEDFNFLDDTLISVVADAMAYQIYTTAGQKLTISVVASDDNTEILKATFPVVIG